MDVAIIYEVSEKADEVKLELLKMGYFNSWSTAAGEGVKNVYLLPDNMVWKKDITLQDALQNIKTAIGNANTRLTLNITLKKCITLNTTPWDGMITSTVKV